LAILLQVASPSQGYWLGMMLGGRVLWVANPLLSWANCLLDMLQCAKAKLEEEVEAFGILAE